MTWGFKIFQKESSLSLSKGERGLSRGRPSRPQQILLRVTESGISRQISQSSQSPRRRGRGLPRGANSRQTPPQVFESDTLRHISQIPQKLPRRGCDLPSDASSSTRQIPPPPPFFDSSSPGTSLFRVTASSSARHGEPSALLAFVGVPSLAHSGVSSKQVLAWAERSQRIQTDNSTAVSTARIKFQTAKAAQDAAEAAQAAAEARNSILIGRLSKARKSRDLQLDFLSVKPESLEIVLGGPLDYENQEKVRCSKEAPENFKCVICFEETKNTLLLPCRHLCICSSCSIKLINASPRETPLGSCPVCRSANVEHVKVFA